jgi:hypothetical protein
MTRQWIEGQIDDALLAIAMGAGFLYVRRRVRRILREVAVGGAIAAGLGTLGVAAAAAAFYRSRTKRSGEPTPPPVPGASSDWQPTGAGTPAAAPAGANSVGTS